MMEVTNAQDRKMNNRGHRNKKQNKIFISWSGINSKEIAVALKHSLEQEVFGAFPPADLQCFVSEEDIASGTDWWNKINSELKSCKMGIVCITKENLNAPWLYYEAGAMVTESIQVIPLLIGCDFSALTNTPLNGKQAIDFYDSKRFFKMIQDIRSTMDYNFIPKKALDSVSETAYTDLRNVLEPVLGRLRNVGFYNVKNVYPPSISTIQLNSVFVSVPMATVDDKKYAELRDFLIHLEEVLKNVGFDEVNCPMLNIPDKEHFDGDIKAINDNFSIMKQMDSLLVIYPERLPSSVLVECGYGIALSKKMVVFYMDSLPWMIQNAGTYIPNLMTRKVKKLEEIIHIIEVNGMVLFEGGSFN